MSSLARTLDLAEGSEGSVASSGSISSSPRPNKWTGPQSTWRKLTERERLISTSMDRLRDQDLSAHLYNAHSMKKRQYDPTAGANIKPWASKDRWRKTRDSDNWEDSDSFVPPKSWTAWPLSGDDVPRSGERVGPADEDDLYTLKRKEIQRPSRELEDILMGITLRFAKERFETREWESPLDQPSTSLDERHANDGNVTDDAQLSEEMDIQNKMDLDEENSDEDGGIEINSKVEGYRGETREDGDTEERVPADKTPHPTVSADDERSRKILRPTIRHALSRLDELLMALHHSRQACLRFRSEQVGSQTEPEAGDGDGNDETENPLSPLNSSPSRSRSRGRPRKAPAMSDPSGEALEDPLEPRRRSNRGRKKKVHTTLEGESEYEMKARIARLQHRTLPSPSAAALKPGPPVRQRKRSRTPGSKPEASLGLRDWSEVLGVAAMVGFSPDIMERTTQRCASIFGEGMDIRFLVESARPGEDDESRRYVPEQIPAMDEPNTRRSGGQNFGIRTSSSRRRRRQRTSRPNSEIGESEGDKPSIESETAAPNGEFFCPHLNCVRHSQGFTRKNHLRSHLKLVHGQTGDETAQSLNGSADEMEGAVHVDRFLRHIRRRAGWRGSDSAPRKRKRNNAPSTHSQTQTDRDSGGQDSTTDLRESEAREDSEGESAGSNWESEDSDS